MQANSSVLNIFKRHETWHIYSYSSFTILQMSPTAHKKDNSLQRSGFKTFCPCGISPLEIESAAQTCNDFHLRNGSSFMWHDFDDCKIKELNRGPDKVCCLIVLNRKKRGLVKTGESHIAGATLHNNCNFPPKETKHFHNSESWKVY